MSSSSIARRVVTSTFTLISKAANTSVHTIVETVKSIYAGQLKKNMPVFAIDTRSLSQYLTSEKDAAIGISKMPLYRVSELTPVPFERRSNL